MPLEALPVEDQVAAVDRALRLWSDASTLTFAQVGDDDPADLNISFAGGDHGDPFPFEDDGTVLGHSYFPGTNRKGDVHLCRAREWSLSPEEGKIDFFTVVLHEIGHALGLEHSRVASAVMAPSYAVAGFTQLAPADVAAIQTLYGSADGSIPPAANPKPGALGTAPTGLSSTGEPDSDGDGVPDSLEVFILDTDPFDGDSDNDGNDDFTETFVDGTVAALFLSGGELDSDGDGLSDPFEAILNSDVNEADSDGDGLSDGFEAFFYGTDPTSADTDGDGLSDFDDPQPTNVRFKIAPPEFADCNGNALDDRFEVAAGSSTDCEENGRPDECDVADDPGVDCNLNDIHDACELAGAGDVDCNGNLVLDECELASGSTSDANGDGILDECELEDCNSDGFADIAQILDGSIEDCDGNFVPDACELNPFAAPLVFGAPLVAPYDVVFDPNSGGFVVTDPGARCLWIVAPFGGAELFVADPRFVDLRGISLDSSGTDFLVADRGANTIWRVTRDATVTVLHSGAPLFRPVDVSSVTSNPSEIYVVDEGGPQPSPPPRVLRRASATAWTVLLEGFPLVIPAAIEEDFDPANLLVVDSAPGALFLLQGPNVSTIAGGTQNVGVKDVVQDIFTGDYVLAGGANLWRVPRGTPAVLPIIAGPPFGKLTGVTQDWSDGTYVVADNDLAAIFRVRDLGDCNGNGVLDFCETQSGAQQDCNLNGIPDACELTYRDCNQNGLPDDCDIAAGTSIDANNNGRPDTCQ